MKKSRIILPAAALLALSSAAAVTGTVAWFTANRIRNVAFTGVTAVNPEQGLLLKTCENSQHTTVTGDADNGFSVAHDLLRDASYDMSAKVLYRSSLTETGTVSAYAVQNIANADTKLYNNNSVYFATQFTMTFGVTRTDNQFNQCLMFDAVNSSVSGTITSADTSIINALRVGIACGDEWVVWAPKTQDETVKNVNGTVVGTNEENTEYVVKAGSALPDDSANPAAKAEIEGRVEYLGVLSHTSDLTVTVTTWFEGLDSDCKYNAADLETAFTANLQFAMRKGATA